MAKETDPEAAEIDEAAEQSLIEPAGPRTYTVGRTLCWAAGALIVALVAAVAITGSLLFAQHRRDTAAAQALAAARSYAVTLTTTDQNSIDKNFTAVIDGATGDFKDAYGKAWSQMRKMLIDNKVVTTGTVSDAGVGSVHDDTVDVLLSVKQVVTSSAAPQPRTDYVSVSMTMRKVGDKWLAEQVVLAGADGKRGK